MAEILIVEDEQILVDVLESRLTKEGYQVEIARNGEQGLEAMRKNEPDLILLDIVMPKMDGLEVLKEMKGTPLAEIPVVVISNSGSPVQIEKAKELGVEDWIIKTEFDPQQAVNKVEQQLG